MGRSVRSWPYYQTYRDLFIECSRQHYSAKAILTIGLMYFAWD